MDNWLLIFALAAVAALVLAIGILVWGLRGQAKAQVEAITALVQGRANDKTFLDAVEPGIGKLLSPFVPMIKSGLDFMKNFTPDDIDQLADAIKLLAERATDGLPNDGFEEEKTNPPPAPPPVG